MTRALVRSFVAVLVASAVALGGGIANGPEHDGSVVDCDIPVSMRIRNVGGIDGAGLCVWASGQMMANQLNNSELADLFTWMQTQKGGGWPARVDAVMKERAPGTKYKQYMGPDISFIQDGINSGRPVCVTYGYGEFYGNQSISHMVICVGMNDKYTVIIDNNDPDNYWWMETPEFRKRFVHPSGEGWAWMIMDPPPPPVPHPAN